jgi:CubicO group peptidase (beta-lactamase class C family)
MKAEKILQFYLLIILSIFLFCCSEDEKTPTESNTPIEEYQYEIPEQKDDGWLTASVEDVGIIRQPLVDMVNFIESSEGHQIHNILIFKDNTLVFEKYFKALHYNSSPPSNGTDTVEYSRDMLHYLASGSKSVTSVLFGIAVKQGFIDANVDKKITEYFPHYTDILIGDKAQISIKHLLTMTSGLDFDENTFPYDDQRNDVTRLFSERDPIKFVLSKSMHALPGTVFHYNSGVTNVIADIVRLETGEDFTRYAEANLFEPLGITDFYWERLRSQYVFASGGLSLRPRDMAKIGSLFINDGQWQGNQILSTEWIEASIQSYTVPDMNITNGYGYQWWVDDGIFMSAGYGGQYMIIAPTLELIIVINCGYFDLPEVVSPFDLVNNYIALAIDV